MKTRAILILAVTLGSLLGQTSAEAGDLSFGGLNNISQLQEGRTMRSSSSSPDWHNGNGDARPIAAGKTLTIANLEGPGVIRHIWNTIAAQERGYSRLVVLRMYWDGEEQPSVECPLGDFFGIGHGLDESYSTLPFRVSSEGRARNCYWPMPFRKSARITVTNEGRKDVRAFYYYVDWEKVRRLPRRTAYFHAMYRQEFPTVMGRNYLIAEIEGRGHYVGTLLNVHQHTGSWWGEGDDFFFIDGEEIPSLRGTGSEDYFCDAWGFRKQEGLFYGIPVMEGYDPFSRTSAYRWHITDPVNFKKSLRVEIEHKGVTFNEDGKIRSGFEERSDDFSSVAYWYQKEPHKPFPALPSAYDRLSVDYSNILEMEAFIPDAVASAGGVSEQKGNWSGGGQVFWTPDTANQRLSIPFETKEAGTYAIVMLLTHSWDYGIFAFELDGKGIGKRMDLFNPAVTTCEDYLGTVELAKGAHVLTIRNVGKSAESKGYFFGLDGMLLNKRK